MLLSDSQNYMVLLYQYGTNLLQSERYCFERSVRWFHSRKNKRPILCDSVCSGSVLVFALARAFEPVSVSCALKSLLLCFLTTFLLLPLLYISIYVLLFSCLGNYRDLIFLLFLFILRSNRCFSCSFRPNCTIGTY